MTTPVPLHFWSALLNPGRAFATLMVPSGHANSQCTQVEHATRTRANGHRLAERPVRFSPSCPAKRDL